MARAVGGSVKIGRILKHIAHKAAAIKSGFRAIATKFIFNPSQAKRIQNDFLRFGFPTGCPILPSFIRVKHYTCRIFGSTSFAFIGFASRDMQLWEHKAKVNMPEGRD